MNLLVTGSSGFIGSKVVSRLKLLGHKVIPYDLVDSRSILDVNQLEELIPEVDAVFHIAAQADLTQMSESIGAGRQGVILNVTGTNNVACLCAKYKKWMIYASTVCVYGNQDSWPEREDSTLPNPAELYSCSKYAGEWIMRGYGYNYGMPWTSLRFATVYGEGMREALGLHIFFSQAIRNLPITVHGDGSQVRTLTYIHDLVDGIVSVLDHPRSQNQVINLSSTEQISALKMAEDVKKITDSSSEIIFIPQRNNQTIHENFDVSKAEKILSWKAKTSWNDGLKLTYDWINETLRARVSA